MGYSTTETFFRPPELERRNGNLPAPLYNRARLLLAHSGGGCLFVPIRSMQFIGVVDRDELVFVDSQAYAVQDGVGGRLITIAWRPGPVAQRASLSEPVACELVFYHAGMQEVQRRLVGEFGRALEQLQRRRQEAPPRQPRILPFRPPAQGCE